MAKAKKRRGAGLTARRGRGGGDMDAQIASLEGTVRPKGVRAAKELFNTHDADVV